MPLDGQERRVVLEADGEHALWSQISLVDPDCELRTQTGATIPLALVPEGSRSVVPDLSETFPEAAFTFTAPTDRVVRVTCDRIASDPVSTVGLGPAVDPTTSMALNRVTTYSGPVLFLLGLTAVTVALVRDWLRSRHGARASVNGRDDG